MQNLSFRPPEVTEKPAVSHYPLMIEKRDSSGRSVLVETKDPYEGLTPESFDLENQLEAGVPLEKISPISSNSVSAIDMNNSNAEKFIDSLKTTKTE